MGEVREVNRHFLEMLMEKDYLPVIAKGASGQLEIVVFAVLFIVFLQRARGGIVPYVAEWLPKLKRQLPSPTTA